LQAYLGKHLDGAMHDNGRSQGAGGRRQGSRYVL